MSRREEFHPIFDPVIDQPYGAIFTYILAPASGPGHFISSMLQAAKIAAYYQECKRPLPPFYFLLDSRVCFGPNPETPSECMREELPKLLSLMLSFEKRDDLGWGLYGPGIFSAMCSALSVVRKLSKNFLDNVTYRNQMLSALAPFFWISNIDPADYLSPNKIHFIRHENRGCAMVVSGASGGYFRGMTNILCVGKTGMDQHPCVIENAQNTLTQHFSIFFRLGYSSVLYVSALGPIHYPSQTLFFTKTDPHSAKNRIVYYEMEPSLPPNACVLNGLQNTSHVIFNDSLRCRQRMVGAIVWAAYLFADMADIDVSQLPQFHFFPVDGSGLVKDQIKAFLMETIVQNRPRLTYILLTIIWHDIGDPLCHLIAKATAPFVFAEGVGTIADVIKKPNTLAFQLDQDDAYPKRTMPSVVSALCKLTSPEIIPAIAELQRFFASTSSRETFVFLCRTYIRRVSVYIEGYKKLVDALRAPQLGLKKCQDEFTVLLLKDEVFSRGSALVTQRNSARFFTTPSAPEERVTVAPSAPEERVTVAPSALEERVTVAPSAPVVSAQSYDAYSSDHFSFTAEGNFSC